MLSTIYFLSVEKGGKISVSKTLSVCLARDPFPMRAASKYRRAVKVSKKNEQKKNGGKDIERRNKKCVAASSSNVAILEKKY